MISPKLETSRLILNRPTEQDIERIAELLNHKIYAENTVNIPYPYGIDDAKFWVRMVEDGLKNENHLILGIRLKENQELIGAIDLGIDLRFNKAELGYWLAKDYWNLGLMTEAAQECIRYGFQNLHLKRIFATHFDFNSSSGKVMEKIGMQKEGILYAHTRKNKEYQNHVLYAIINPS